MKKNLYSLTIEEFTQVLLDYEEVYEFQIDSYKKTFIKRKKEQAVFKGTYSQLMDITMNAKEVQKYVEDTFFDYDIKINSLDIYNYLDHITNGFEKERVKRALSDMELFYDMTYTENINKEVELVYISRKEKKPLTEIKDPKSGVVITIPDYREMREHIFPCREWQYQEAVTLLKDKLNNGKSNQISGGNIQNKSDVFINENKKLPKELATNEAKELFNEIINLNFCEIDGNLYKWVGTLALFGYFVDKASDYLDVRPSNGRLPWKIFKVAFQCSDKDIKTASQAVNDYKNKGLSEPEGFYDIRALCKE